MSQRGVEALLGRMLTDSDFRHRFFEEPIATLTCEGMDVTEREVEAVMSLQPTRIAAFARELDARIVRAAVSSLHVPAERDDSLAPRPAATTPTKAAQGRCGR